MKYLNHPPIVFRYDFYEKAVTFRPYQVDMLDPVTANFLGDNLRCWMQIQVGKGPQAQEVSGIVKIGQTMTMVLGVKDDENKFDMMVRNCVGMYQNYNLMFTKIDSYSPTPKKLDLVFEA